MEICCPVASSSNERRPRACRARVRLPGHGSTNEGLRNPGHLRGGSGKRARLRGTRTACAAEETRDPLRDWPHARPEGSVRPAQLSPASKQQRLRDSGWVPARGRAEYAVAPCQQLLLLIITQFYS